MDRCGCVEAHLVQDDKKRTLNYVKLALNLSL